WAAAGTPALRRDRGGPRTRGGGGDRADRGAFGGGDHLPFRRHRPSQGAWLDLERHGGLGRESRGGWAGWSDPRRRAGDHPLLRATTGTPGLAPSPVRDDPCAVTSRGDGGARPRQRRRGP